MISLPIGCTYRPGVKDTPAPHQERVVGVYVVNGTSLHVDQITRSEDSDQVPTVTLPISGNQTVIGAFRNVHADSVLNSFFWVERQI